MQDEAYRYCMEQQGKYIFYFSAAGASNKGLYRFSRENLEFAVGMDDDMSLFSNMIAMSVVKHMDKAVIKMIGDLLKNKDIPYHQDFTYSSGYEELVYMSGVTADLFLDISDIRNRIVEIEQRYEESYQ
jgi:basic membrane lipoprotein Med (substrate-binding protein (PBP1-ABC) superfamily)